RARSCGSNRRYDCVGSSGRRGAARGQGPRGLPGRQRRAPVVLRCPRGRSGACRVERPMMDTATAARAVQGRLIGTNLPFSRVTTDTRTLAAGDLFVALKGDQFDGHDFVPVAFERGASAVLVADERADALAGERIAVPDPLAALGQLASYWRR